VENSVPNREYNPDRGANVYLFPNSFAGPLNDNGYVFLQSDFRLAFICLMGSELQVFNFYFDLASDMQCFLGGFLTNLDLGVL
jgi:hypothetical protein